MVSIICSNREEEVKQLCSRLEMDNVWVEECSLAISSTKQKAKANLPVWLPIISTLEMLFKHHQDIRVVLKKPLLRSLVEHTTVEEDKRKVAMLCSKEGGQEYRTKVRDFQMTLLELLAMIPSCMPPEIVLLEHLPVSPLLSLPFALGHP
jgi:sulfite reductase alpha subunit-like flavoprotein